MTKESKMAKTKTTKDFCFSGVSEKNHFEWLHKESFKNFLELFERGKSRKC